MHNIRKWWGTCSRKKRSVFFLLGIGVSLLVLYFYCSCPAFTLKQKFRRAEKADLIGPSAILGLEYVEMPNYTQPVFVAVDETTVTLCGCYSTFLDDNTYLINRKKTGDLTILVWPRTADTMPHEAFEVPVFLFDSHPEAKRAELEFTLTWDESFSREYQLEVQRERSGYFRFDILCPASQVITDASGVSEIDGRDASLLYSLALASDYNGGVSRAQFPITVRLYNNRDELICEETVTVQSAAVEAHIENGDPIE